MPKLIMSYPTKPKHIKLIIRFLLDIRKLIMLQNVIANILKKRF